MYIQTSHQDFAVISGGGAGDEAVSLSLSQWVPVPNSELLLDQQLLSSSLVSACVGVCWWVCSVLPGSRDLYNSCQFMIPGALSTDSSALERTGRVQRCLVNANGSRGWVDKGQ